VSLWDLYRYVHHNPELEALAKSRRWERGRGCLGDLGGGEGEGWGWIAQPWAGGAGQEQEVGERARLPLGLGWG